MQDFLEWTAWEMERPKAYGPFHLIFFFAGLAVCLLGAWLLRKCSDRCSRAVLLTAGGVLIATEVYKQLFYTFVIGGSSYQWWIFPFQLCSVPMYLCIAAGLLPECRARQYMLDFMVSYNLMGGAIAFLEPSGLCHEYWSLTLHAFVWHMLLVFVGLQLGFSGKAGRRISDFKNAVVMYCALCAVAFCINLVLWRVSEGTINMFYVGPRNSPIIVFKEISERLGWYVNTPIYMLANTLAALGFFCLFALPRQKRAKLAAANA